MATELPGEATSSTGAVFLSYASQDAAAAARVCEALRRAQVAVWFDQSELRGGDVWDQKIRRQIRDCTLFMPIISANTAARHEGYFRLEWDLADQRSRMMARDRTFIVPLCLDETPAAGTDLPESFHRVQWTRLPGGDTPASFGARIAGLLSPGIPPARPAAAPGDPAAGRLARVPGWRSKPAWILAVALLLSVAGLVAALLRTPDQQRPPDTPPRPGATGSMSATDPPAPAPAAEKSIAILPFLDLSEKHDQEYFSDGLTEELIDRLSQARNLKVIARTSCFYFKGRQATIAEIAKTLAVTHVLEGSVRKSGNSLRISAQLIRAADGAPVWSQTFDRQLVDIFDLQKELAATVGEALEVVVAGREAAPRESTLAAYNLRLEADFIARRQNKPNTVKAIGLYRDALAIDPHYARAWDHLGEAYLTLTYFGMAGSESIDAALSRAGEALEHALLADPNLGEAYVLKARIAKMQRWDWPEAAAAYTRAGQLDASLDTGRGLAGIAAAFGRPEASVQADERALRRDPVSTDILYNLAWTYLAAGRFDESIGTYQRIADLDPTFASVKALEAEALLLSGKPDAALARVNEEPDDAWRISMSPVVYWALGRRHDSDTALDELERKYAASSAYNIAQMRAYRGEVDAAFRWLDRAYRQHDGGLMLIKLDPLVRNLHADPRYTQLLTRLKLDGPAPPLATRTGSLVHGAYGRVSPVG